MSDPGASPSAPVPGADHAAVSPGTLDRALALVRFLRSACPWDAAQTPTTLVPHLLEETHETVDAIHADDPEALEGELGDLLLNLAFQVVLGEELGHFDADSVTGRLEHKMRRRHPHLYGLGEHRDWEALKAGERDEGEGVLTGLASGLDPLTRAHRMQEKVAGVGFDWEDHRGAWAKVSEELEEVREALEEAKGEALEEELGDLLFAVVNLVRLSGAHPVSVLDRANRKFHRRFDELERRAAERGVALGEVGLEVLDRLWDEIKDEERSQ
jgi:nucleoside triphosphate diphosphatase